MIDAAKKTQFEQRAVIGLLVFFAFALYGALKNMGLFHARAHSAAPVRVTSIPVAPARRAASAGIPKPSTAAAPAPSRAEYAAPAPGGPSVYTAQTLRDPLKGLLPPREPQHPVSAASSSSHEPPAAPAITPPQLSVQGLWWQGSKPMAIINGRIYGVGDQVEGATITAIHRTGITLTFQGTTMQVTTGGPPTKSGKLSQSAQWR